MMWKTLIFTSSLLVVIINGGDLQPSLTTSSPISGSRYESVTTQSRYMSTPFDNLQPPPLRNPNRYKPQRQQEATFVQKVANFFGFGYGRPEPPVQTIAPQTKFRNTERSAMVAEPLTQTNYPSNTYTPQNFIHQSHQLQQHNPYPNSQQQISVNYLPCNKMPWVPMYNGAEIPIASSDRPEKLQDYHYSQNQHSHYQPTAQPQQQQSYSPPKRHQPPYYPQYSNNNNNNNQQNSWSQPANLLAEKLMPPLMTPAPHPSGVTSPEYLLPPHRLPLQQNQHHLVPIPVPNLSVTPIPPLYDYKPFLSDSYGTPLRNTDYHSGFDSGRQHSGNSGGAAKITNIIVGTNVGNPNRLPANQVGYTPGPVIVPTGPNTVDGGGGYPPGPSFKVGSSYPIGPSNAAPSVPASGNVNPNIDPKTQVETIPPIFHQSQTFHLTQQQAQAFQAAQQAYPSNNYNGPFNDLHSDFEIIKSIPLIQFTSSVEYPTKFVQTPIINHLQQSPQIQQAPIIQPVNNHPNNQPIAQTTVHQVKPTTPQKYISHPIVVDTYEPDHVTDSYTAASSHNVTLRHEDKKDVGNYGNHVQEQSHNSLDSNEPVAVQSTTKFAENSHRANTNEDFSDIEIHASVQTAADNGNLATFNINPKKDRETPKNLLDSPIFYLRGSSPKPFTRDPSELRVSPKFENTPWQPSSMPQTATTIHWNTGSPFREAISSASSVNSKSDANGSRSGLNPPPPPPPSPSLSEAVDSINVITKRPKQIQIIIPYTSNNKPQPFKATDIVHQGEVRVPPPDKFKGWSNSHQGHDYHVEQESKVVTATETPAVPKTTKYLTKILASSIRDLLKNEREVTKSPKLSFDLVTLQKNIDDWTEQEFASELHKASTISLLAPSKQIPDEYLTTTPSLKELGMTTTEMPPITTTNEPPQADEDPKVYRIINEIIDDNRLNSEGRIEITTQYSQNSNARIESTEESPKLWSHLKVAISPLTQEKVYVVTPQPVWDPSKHQNNEQNQDSVGNFKSPRFIVRPTPGSTGGGSTSYILGLTLSQSVNNLQTTTKKPFTPELFGILGSTPYLHSTPIEDDEEEIGYSKKITIVTASPNRKKFSRTEEKKSLLAKALS